MRTERQRNLTPIHLTTLTSECVCHAVPRLRLTVNSEAHKLRATQFAPVLHQSMAEVCKQQQTLCWGYICKVMNPPQHTHQGFCQCKVLVP